MTFTWEKFDPSFLKAVLLASEEFEDEYDEIRNEDDVYGLCAMMNSICDFPDRRFIMNYRAVIEQDLLKNYPDEIRKICKALKITGTSFNIKQAALTRKATSTSLINAYISALLDISGIETVLNENSKFRYTVSLNMAQTPVAQVPLHDYQEKAVAELKKHFIDNDMTSGLLVMPTGSGKSRTATYFLIREMISRGYQILWIAHRHMLLDQAADCFYDFAGLSKIENPKIREYRINCISGEHLSIRQVKDSKSEVIVASIGSICRNKTHLRRILGSKVMIVVDEAHHTFAPTYQDVIKFIGKYRKNTKLLGLTATPVRANEKDSKKLLGIYGNSIIYNVSMSELIAKGFLSDPKCIRVDTGKNFESQISEEEARQIRRYKELPETLVSKIASSQVRNQIILKEYLDNKEKYGKTIIFAMNVVHCRFLYEELKKNGVKCGLVYSGKDDNQIVISDFKENKIDVLVNVNIMTEGSDVPDIQTVFLTRPTQSEGLLMQMIGRGMRGKAAHGTETVNIVDFHDQWDVFRNWLNPQHVISDEIADEDAPETREYKKPDYETYEWKLCKEIYDSCTIRAAAYGKTVSLPTAWYTLIDEEGELYRMLVFEDQLKGILAMKKDKTFWIDNLKFTAEDALKKYFSYFCNRPSARDLEIYMDNVRNCEDMPVARVMENRKSVEPYYVAMAAEEHGVDIFEAATKAYEQFNVAQDIYGTLEQYQMAVCKAKMYKDKSAIEGFKVEELPVELIPFDRTPCYNLDELVQEVKDERFGGTYDGLGPIEWTDKPYKQFYGRLYHADNSIRINCVLDSKDVPREVVKFVIYHEMLHRDNHSHNKAFKEEEYKYPDYEIHEAFLDSNMYLFDIKEW